MDLRGETSLSNWSYLGMHLGGSWTHLGAFVWRNGHTWAHLLDGNDHMDKEPKEAKLSDGPWVHLRVKGLASARQVYKRRMLQKC